jgi:hypothetical protein
MTQQVNDRSSAAIWQQRLIQMTTTKQTRPLTFDMNQFTSIRWNDSSSSNLNTTAAAAAVRVRAVGNNKGSRPSRALYRYVFLKLIFYVIKCLFTRLRVRNGHDHTRPTWTPTAKTNAPYWHVPIHVDLSKPRSDSSSNLDKWGVEVFVSQAL